MKRRDFLKLVGIAVLSPSLPAPKALPFQPNPAQKIYKLVWDEKTMGPLMVFPSLENFASFICHHVGTEPGYKPGPMTVSYTHLTLPTILLV